MSVGGQLPASLIYTVETRPKEKWGLFGSFVMMAANIGTLLGNLVGALLRTLLTDEELLAWGWRIPFWSGIVISFVAIYLRLHGDEHHPNEGQYQSEESEVTEEHLPKHPLREAIRKENLMALVSATLTPMLWGAGFYVSFVWMAIYMSELIDKPMESAFWINCIALTIGIIIPVPFGGWISDKCGRAKTMVVGALGLGGLGPVLLYVISRGHPFSACLCQICLGWFLSLFGGPLGAWLGERFPSKVRLTSVSLGYDIAHSTASGFSPMIATILAQKINPTAPGIIYTFFALIAFIGLTISTQIQHDDIESCAADNGTVGGNTAGATAFEQEASEEKSEAADIEPAVNPIV
jgi:MHS family proline/betaine transporter-like MFS transporter